MSGEGARDPRLTPVERPISEMIQRRYVFPGVLEMNYQSRRRMGVNIYLIDGGIGIRPDRRRVSSTSCPTSSS